VPRLIRALILLLVPPVVLAATNIDSWRLGSDGLAILTNVQGWYAVVPFLVAWALADGSPGRGALVGGAEGLLSILAYYAYSWLVHGAHSATSQLGASGAAWIVGATLGGFLYGALGGLAGAHPDRRPVVRAFAFSVTAATIAAEAVMLLTGARRRFDLPRLDVAAVGLFVVAVALVGLAWTRTGRSATLRALLVAVVLGAVGFAALLALEERFAYPTL
jgi:hypothetical protein